MSNAIHSEECPNDYEWGERTVQAADGYPFDGDPPANKPQHTDCEEMVRRFKGIKSPADYSRYKKYEYPLPDLVTHTDDGRYFGHVKGTNLLAVGEKGSGKSTLALFLAFRLMDDAVRLPPWARPDIDETNDREVEWADPKTVTDTGENAVVWRGQMAASEWLPYKPWTTLWIPDSVPVNAVWEPEDVRNTDTKPADLAREVREVRRYEDPREVNDGLKPGTFNVVYPGPAFQGCEEIMADSDYCPEPVSFTPKWHAEDDNDVTPLVHWWFAFLTAKLEYGPYNWTTLLFDEAADFAPQGARADKNETYTKIRGLRKVVAQSRKHYLSLFFFGHHEENLHSKIRRTIQWRIDMPDGTANRNSNQHSSPVGFSQIPMCADMLSRKSPGLAICWDETNYSRFTWPDIVEFREDRNRWLSLNYDTPSGGGTSL